VTRRAQPLADPAPSAELEPELLAFIEALARADAAADYAAATAPTLETACASPT
jgi:hypothetical protein